MTVPSLVDSNTYVANGTNATYTYNFRVLQATDLLVQVENTTGIISTLTLGVDYTVAGVSQYTGGTITLTAGNLTLNYILFILRRPAILQNTSLQTQGAYDAKSVETMGDLETMIDQAQQTQLGRCLQGPLLETTNMVFPSALLRASQYPIFDPNGNITVTSLTPATSTMTTVLNVTALKNVAAPLSTVIYATTGYYTNGDGGAGFYWWDSVSVVADNGGTILQLTAGGSGRFILIPYNSIVNVNQFGAKGDGLTDDTVRIQACFDAQPIASTIGALPKIVFEQGKRYIIGTATAIGSFALTISRTMIIDFNGAALSFAGVAGSNGVLFNNSEITTYKLRILKPSYSMVDATTFTGVGVKFLSDGTHPCQKNRTYDLYVEGFGFGLVMQGDLAGCAYNDFYSPRLKNNAIGVVLDSTNNANSYCTTNNYYGGEITIVLNGGAIYTGTRNIDIRNSNSFHFTAQIVFSGTVVEGPAERKIKCTGAYCQFNNLDFDAGNGGTDIEFTSTSNNCQIFGGGALDSQVIINIGLSNWLYGTSKGVASTRTLVIDTFDTSGVRVHGIAYNADTDIYNFGIYQQSRFCTTQTSNNGVPVLVGTNVTTIPAISDGIIQVQCDVECAIFFVRANTVTKLVGTANTANTNTAGKLCCYPAGGTAVNIAHNLGGAKVVTIIANFT